ncbi:hypothetical protein X474_27400 [Dethiosulfatarculus sandiegensis]|uniref:Uncharacterized protein n=1 Tax=Dethiosulfatarculus sandiegensis TaxID=1429043 RepID=A0A0D2J5S8_9BACT|nr:hypothetical protein X474_27400 [Dethiosulfatarculus sandiegensis]
MPPPFKHPAKPIRIKGKGSLWGYAKPGSSDFQSNPATVACSIKSLYGASHLVKTRAFTRRHPSQPGKALPESRPGAFKGSG